MQTLFSQKEILKKPVRKPTVAEVSDAPIILKQLEMIFNDREEYRRLLMQRGSLAQALLDLLQTLYDYPGINRKLHSNISAAIIRLSKKSGLYPRCFYS
ncbi:hypothetical protein K435DRAFT_38352 [Dendrothele bispora CBS 962.96]|uniref:Uncharacterized protein n=1 Tax=Dendrothele bispora (strain CBS 962.96) TaxID=1314807 RepID=A0A4S8KT46_DENBC|nr:hypothetical protein K435DRAFT_38352 [Dendrothele bispora CBS 962.96]